MIEENHEKIPVRLVGTVIWTRDLPNASLVRHHGSTLLGNVNVVQTGVAYVPESQIESEVKIQQIRLHQWFSNFPLPRTTKCK